MTRNPDGLYKLEMYFEKNIGPYWLGTVGDDRHTYGYHLGAFEAPFGDYSTVHSRDVAGINKYGGYWASAIDVGMGWQAARDWLKWLTNETNKGTFPDIREIRGSTDGRIAYCWDVPTKKVYAESTTEHLPHTHIAFFRDSIFRNHDAIFAGWTRSGRTLPKPTSTMRVGSKPTPVVAKPTPAVVPAGEGSGFWSPETVVLAAGVGALAWVVKRRIEVARADSE